MFRAVLLVILSIDTTFAVRNNRKSERQTSAENVALHVRQAPNGADSVHLWPEDSADATMYYNDIIVSETVAATYFCTIRFHHGYLGIQHMDARGKKQAIFSLWDVVDVDHLNRTARPDELAEVVARGQGVTGHRFNGEGTGVKTLYPHQWSLNTKIQMLLVADSKPQNYVHYTALIYLPAQKKWKLLATLKRSESYKYLQQFDIFLEDWSGMSGRVARTASLDPWIRKEDGTWYQSKKADFSQSGTKTNLNAWTAQGRFFMKTGGSTTKTVSPTNKVERIINDPLPDALKDIDDIINNKTYLP